MKQESHAWLREKMPIAFLVYRAPVAARRFLALNDVFPLLAEFGVRCREMPAHPVLQIAGTNGAACCQQFPDPVQFAPAICCSIAPAWTASCLNSRVKVRCSFCMILSLLCGASTLLSLHPPLLWVKTSSSSTVESYARSARAFCQWLVRHRCLQATPFAHLHLPQVENRLLHTLEPEEWEHLLLACRPSKKTDVLAEWATTRNRAVLWLLFDTGMRASEPCELRLADVDREQGIVRARGKGPHARRLTLGHEGRRHLLAYLDEDRLREGTCREPRGASEDYLFLPETGRPLTKNGMTLLFGRLRKRAGITRKGVSPSQLREGFGAISASRRQATAVAGTAGLRRSSHQHTLSVSEHSAACGATIQGSLWRFPPSTPTRTDR